MGSDDRCANCGAALAGPYCALCGQRARELDSTAALVREALDEIFTLEGRPVRTLRCLLLKPGLVAAEYIGGRRRSYTPPVRLFLSASAAFFFTFMATRPVAGRYYGYDSTGAESYADTMSTALIVILPLAAVVLKAFYVRPARPLVQHLVFALYSGSTALLWFLILMLGAAALRAWFGHYSASPAWLPDFVIWLYMPGLALFAGHLAAALRRTYGSSWAGSVFRSIGLITVIGALTLVALPRLLAVLK